MATQLSIGACVGVLALSLVILLVFSLLLSHFRFKRFAEKTEVEKQDDYLTARNTQHWVSLGLSFYASGMGSWLLFATPETGMLASWLGVIAYGIANASPFWLMTIFGPMVKNALGGRNGFTISDFAKRRYGEAMHWLIGMASLFFMGVFLSAELTSIGSVFQSVQPDFPVWAAVTPISVITLVYTLFGGAPASIGTDRIQGVILAILAIIATAGVSSTVLGDLKPHSFAEASKPTTTGVNAIFVLWLSTTLNQFLEHGMWLRVFAARSDRDLRKGLFLGGAMSIPTVILFGVVGIVASAAKISGLVNIPDGMEFSAFFTLLTRLHSGWLLVVTFFGVCLVTSTIDSLQTGLQGMAAASITIGDRRSLWIPRVVCFVVNCIATAISLAQYSVLTIFLTSNIISCAVVPVLFLGFHRKVTTFAAFAGFGCGILTILICGWSFMGSFGSGFKWFIFPLGPYHHGTVITFLAVPTVTALVALGVGYWQCYRNPELENSHLEAMSWTPDQEADCEVATGDRRRESALVAVKTPGETRTPFDIENSPSDGTHHSPVTQYQEYRSPTQTVDG